MRLIVGISGATGAIYGIRLLEILHELKVETHLVLSDAGKKTIQLETAYDPKKIEDLASEVHALNNIGASIASGSFKTNGMIIAPCSIKSLSAIAHSYNENLLIRAADVIIKEKRKLVLVVRETPLHEGHLELMTAVAKKGGVILPPMPAFYNLPRSIDDIVNQTVGKVLDQYDLEHNLYRRWDGSLTGSGT
ncbi:MAG: UbiX family flavin prenyltransferase [Firmicutes bacterium]|nr:UbiX family flavin prenyltransferase [Bacillota bacterium]